MGTNFKHDAVILELKGSILMFKWFTFYLVVQKRIQFSALVMDNIYYLLFNNKRKEDIIPIHKPISISILISNENY